MLVPRGPSRSPVWKPAVVQRILGLSGREGWQQVFMHDTEVGPVMAVRHATDPSHLVNESTNPMSWDRAEAEAFADAAAPAAPTTAPVVSSSPVAPQTPITPARVVASVQQERLGTYEEDDDEDPRFNGQGKGSFIRAEYPWLIQKRKRQREEEVGAAQT